MHFKWLQLCQNLHWVIYRLFFLQLNGNHRMQPKFAKSNVPTTHPTNQMILCQHKTSIQSQRSHLSQPAVPQISGFSCCEFVVKHGSISPDCLFNQTLTTLLGFKLRVAKGHSRHIHTQPLPFSTIVSPYQCSACLIGIAIPES